MPPINETEICAYVAGLIDGEGYFAVIRNKSEWLKTHTKRGYCDNISLTICNMNKELLVSVQHILKRGDIVTHRRPNKPPSFTLRFYPNALRVILPKIIPYLLLKKRQAQLMLSLLNIRQKHMKKKLKDEEFHNMLEKFRAEFERSHIHESS